MLFLEKTIIPAVNDNSYSGPGLIQAVFDICILILGTVIWVCTNLILSKTKTTIKSNSSFFDQIKNIQCEYNSEKINKCNA